MAATLAGEESRLEARDARALTEAMTVIPTDAPDIFLVVSASGSEYRVDARHNSCECGDARHRDRTCKHQRRVAFATGRREIPGWVDEDAVDDQLGEQVALGTEFHL
jgi:hypothetical protein